MENRNEWDEDRFLLAQAKLEEALEEMWLAGADEERIVSGFEESLASGVKERH